MYPIEKTNKVSLIEETVRNRIFLSIKLATRPRVMPTAKEVIARRKNYQRIVNPTV